ncbi:MAG: permease-like cell division protein FtsX [Nevskiales bacterium]
MSRTSPRPFIARRLFQAHARALLFTAGKLYRKPGAALLTAAVIGITLALPAGLHVLVNNLDGLRYGWESSVQASLFLKQDVSDSDGQKLAKQLAEREDVAAAHYISRQQGLEEFRKLSGFGAALDLLEDNPLPAVISVQPITELNKQQAEALRQALEQLDAVDSARMDQIWLERLQGFLHIARRLSQSLALLFGLAVIIAVGNTIRLEIENRREEIEVMKLLGATNAFVHRPFLYLGLWYGLAGGILAWVLTQVMLWLLAGPVKRLAGLYDSQFALAGMDFGTALGLILAAIALGITGSAWTVTRHLRNIEPN